MSAARKAAESTIKHENLVDALESLGKRNNLDVEATIGNDPRGDVRVNKKDFEQFILLIKEELAKKK